MQQLAGANKKRKRTGSVDAFPIVNGIIMLVIVVITLYPVLNTLAISLNDGTDALRGGIYLWPRKFTWKNYITVLQKDNLITGAYVRVARRGGGPVPDSLEESAQLDGAGYTTIFLKIYCPLCKPVFATVALFVAVGQWNSWFDAMLYNRMNSDLTTLQYELMKLLSSVTNQGTSAEAMKNAVGTVTPTSVRSAATILTMLPIICIYPFLQKYFVTGLTLGGVKE